MENTCIRVSAQWHRFSWQLYWVCVWYMRQYTRDNLKITARTKKPPESGRMTAKAPNPQKVQRSLLKPLIISGHMHDIFAIDSDMIGLLWNDQETANWLNCSCVDTL